MDKKEMLRKIDRMLYNAYLDNIISRRQLDELRWKMLEEFQCINHYGTKGGE